MGELYTWDTTYSGEIISLQLIGLLHGVRVSPPFALSRGWAAAR